MMVKNLEIKVASMTDTTIVLSIAKVNEGLKH